MNFKIISIVLLLLFTSSIACAGENTEVISFEDVDFNIPDNFTQGDVKDYNKLGSEGKLPVFENESETIEIIVINDWMGMSLDDLYIDGALSKTVNQHKGWSYTKNNIDYFSYAEDNKGIIVGSSNHELLNEIII